MLLSAGLDSAVLAAAEARRGHVHPIYVSVGLAWEAGELAALSRLLATPLYASMAPLARLSFPAQDLYPPTHWAIVGTPPGFDTPDEDVYLTGRNVMLLSKAGIYCAQKRLERIAIGPLAGNPFPDATDAFFSSMSRTLSLGLAHEVAIAAPFAGMHKQRRRAAGARARRAAGAHALVHEPGGAASTAASAASAASAATRSSRSARRIRPSTRPDQNGNGVGRHLLRTRSSSVLNK